MPRLHLRQWIQLTFELLIPNYRGPGFGGHCNRISPFEEERFAKLQSSWGHAKDEISLNSAAVELRRRWI